MVSILNQGIVSGWLKSLGGELGREASPPVDETVLEDIAQQATAVTSLLNIKKN